MRKTALGVGLAVIPAALHAQPAAAAEEALVLRLRGFVLVGSSWLLLLAALVLAVIAAAGTLRWLAARRRQAPTRIFRLQLKVRGPSQLLGVHSFDYYPVTVASRGAADLVLPAAGAGGGFLRFDFRGGQALLESVPARLVNGVRCRQKKLRSGDRIAFGVYRLDFLEAAVDETRRPEPGAPPSVWPLPMAAALLALAVLFRQGGGAHEEAAHAERVVDRTAQSAELWPPAAAPSGRPEPLLAGVGLPLPAGAVTPNPVAAAAPAAEQSDPRPEAAVPAASGAPTAALTPRAPRVFAPGEEVEYFPADILFIHAHPDDETLDFGVLMAGASLAGKRVAVVLFTDGESGLDLYPQRTVGDIYPARRLAGAPLAQVRVVEATRALSLLGAEAYVRLGLANRPYAREQDALSVPEVLELWGGEERLVARLIGIIEGFRPALVVSPDGRTRAHEHFEHEAVGHLVREALAVLGPGAPYLRGHLVCVDPGQSSGYDALIRVPALRPDPVSGRELRALQSAALIEHATQRDAAVLGVARLSRMPYECYAPLLWRGPQPPDLEPFLN